MTKPKVYMKVLSNVTYYSGSCDDVAKTFGFEGFREYEREVQKMFGRMGQAEIWEYETYLVFVKLYNSPLVKALK